jgi:hypothetical protein
MFDILPPPSTRRQDRRPARAAATTNFFPVDNPAITEPFGDTPRIDP